MGACLLSTRSVRVNKMASFVVEDLVAILVWQYCTNEGSTSCRGKSIKEKVYKGGKKGHRFILNDMGSVQ